MAATEPPTIIFKAEHKKAKEKMRLHFYQGRKVFPRNSIRKGPLVSHWLGRKGNAARETGKVRVRRWGGGQDARDSLEEP